MDDYGLKDKVGLIAGGGSRDAPTPHANHCTPACETSTFSTTPLLRLRPCGARAPFFHDARRHTDGGADTRCPGKKGHNSSKP